MQDSPAPYLRLITCCQPCLPLTHTLCWLPTNVSAFCFSTMAFVSTPCSSWFHVAVWCSAVSAMMCEFVACLIFCLFCSRINVCHLLSKFPLLLCFKDSRKRRLPYIWVFSLWTLSYLLPCVESCYLPVVEVYAACWISAPAVPVLSLTLLLRVLPAFWPDLHALPIPTETFRVNYSHLWNVFTCTSYITNNVYLVFCIWVHIIHFSQSYKCLPGPSWGTCGALLLWGHIMEQKLWGKASKPFDTAQCPRKYVHIWRFMFKRAFSTKAWSIEVFYVPTGIVRV